MRSISCLALACAVFASTVGLIACKDEGGGIDAGDMAGDFSMPSVTPPQKTGCLGYSLCITDCFNTGDATTTLAGCQTKCGKNAVAGAANKWSAVLACGQSYCLGDVDAGGNKCTLNSTMDKLVDRPGDPTNTCGDCLQNSLARLFGEPCMTMSSPDCNPTSCTAVTDACLNDKP